MNFEQKIKYLDFYEGNVRLRGAGFMRLECWGNTCNLILQVSGLPEIGNGNYPVSLTGEDREETLGEISLEKGKGRWELRGLDCENVKGLAIREVRQLRIRFGGERRLVAVLLEEAVRKPDALKMKDEKAGIGKTEDLKVTDEKVETGKTEDLKVTDEKVGTGKTEDLKVKDEKAETGKTEDLKVKDEKTESEKPETLQVVSDKPEIGEPEIERTETEVIQNVTEVRAANASEKALGSNTKMMAQNDASGEGEARKERPVTAYAYVDALKPGKWEQLRAIYPPISPFGDSRKYLQISPGDFVILKDRSYRMVNNSFLLHGYFTYKHLILHRMNRKGETVYYVGVPGSYYNKEKEVAILFGFESFEGATEPAREGDFGYYMMRVEL